MKMTTFKAYFKKEIMESSRQYKYIILAIGIIAFAILDPFMLKILPKILEKQLQGDLRSLFVATPKSAIISYINHLFQIGNLFIIFTLASSLSDEINGEKLVFPYSKGSRPSSIVIAKITFYTILVTILTFVGFLTCYYYGSFLFKGEKTSFSGIINSSILMSVYFFFNITLVTLFSSLVKKGVTAGFITLIITFLSSTLVNSHVIGKFIPYKLVLGANLFTLESYSYTIIFTVIFSLIFIILTIFRMNKVEVI
jgi:ABC-2 type transport system permease protein